MQLSKEEYKRIFKKYLAGEATPEEILFVERYYAAFDTEGEYTESINDAERAHLEVRMKERINDQLFSVAEVPVKYRRFAWLKYTAIVSFCVLGISLFYFSRQHNESKQVQLAVTPVVEQLTLKLANGQIIYLDSTKTDQTINDMGGVTIAHQEGDELVYQLNGEIRGTDDTQLYNELAIPKGKQFKLILPDGTKVWLNTASTLRYPVRFAKHERRVILTGEAYFDVTADKSKPFFVQCKESEISVTGTQFNVSAYADESEVKTTLVEGRVAVSYRDQRIQLQPGDQVISNKSDTPMKKVRTDLDLATAWKDGFFVFDQPLEEVTRMLARWYDLQIGMDGDLPQKRVAGRFSRKRDFREILNYLSQLSGFAYSVNGHHVNIKYK